MENDCPASDDYDESVFANLRDDTNLCNQYISKRIKVYALRLSNHLVEYAVHTTFGAVEYGLGVNDVTPSRKCTASDRKDLANLIQNVVRPFDSYRRLAMVIVALIYIERAKSSLKQPDIHRTIFLSAIMLATKVSFSAPLQFGDVFQELMCVMS